MSTEHLDPSLPPALPATADKPRSSTRSPGLYSLAIFRRQRSHDWKNLSIVIVGSLILHAIALGACALIVLQNPLLLEEIFTTVVDQEPSTDPIVEQSLQPDQINENSQDSLVSLDATSKLQFENQGTIELNVSDAIPQIAADPTAASGLPELNISNETAGRMSVPSKRAMLTKFGGNSASEAAVAAGMKWLLNHQLPNGSWSFAHSKHIQCKGQCSQDGSFAACPTGATAMALLVFLGAGHTHQGGDHQPQVKKAIDFLLKSGKSTPTGIDFRGKVTANEGMYVQGLCAIALCECAAMTKRDHRITKAAEGAVEFIIKAQNRTDGGWRYQPLEAGDLSVTGWQIMALKSAYNAKLTFPARSFSQTMTSAEKFLKADQADDGARYRYLPSSEPTPTMTAVGLLCRMYLGWDHKNRRLAEGIEYLDKFKPQPNNMYFNYYATQVMHHWGGEEWNRWNEVMRDQLIRTQHPLKDGHLAGSWDIADPHGDRGGRLYMTCLSVMTLEVYYRHLPMYSRDKLKIEF